MYINQNRGDYAMKYTVIDALQLKIERLKEDRETATRQITVDTIDIELSLLEAAINLLKIANR
jgi:hypothetical protein